MEVVIRNLTKDNGKDFDNDFSITLPMDTNKLKDFLGSDEWIIVDCPIGEELTNICDINDILSSTDEETVRILSTAYWFHEVVEIIENDSYVIVNFDEETSLYNGGNGVYHSDWWKGYILRELGYVSFPFEYKKEMEDYLKFEQLWYTAESEGWEEVSYNGKTYLVNAN